MKIVVILVVALTAMVFGGYAFSAKKSPNKSLPVLASLISGDDSTVVSEVSLFEESAADYFKKHEDSLYERGIEEKEGITKEVVLVDALMRAKKLVYRDGSYEPQYFLKELDVMSGNKLSSLESYSKIEKEYSELPYGVGEILDGEGKWTSIFEFVNNAGLSLLAIDDGSDSYAVFLVPSSKKQAVIDASKAAGINLYFGAK